MRAVGEHAQVDEAALFQAGDDFHLPAGGGAHPVAKGAAVAGVAQGAGGDHAHAVGGVGLDGAMKAPQHAQGVRHGLRIERSVGEDALAQARDFAVFVQGLQAAAHHLGDFQPDRVGTDVDRGECWHARGSKLKSISERKKSITRA